MRERAIKDYDVILRALLMAAAAMPLRRHDMIVISLLRYARYALAVVTSPGRDDMLCALFAMRADVIDDVAADSTPIYYAPEMAFDDNRMAQCFATIRHRRCRCCRFTRYALLITIISVYC